MTAEPRHNRWLHRTQRILESMLVRVGSLLLVVSLFLPIAHSPMTGVNSPPAKGSLLYLIFLGLIIDPSYILPKLLALMGGFGSFALLLSPFFVAKSRAKGRLAWFTIAAASLVSAVGIVWWIPLSDFYAGFYVMIAALSILTYATGAIWFKNRTEA